MKTIKHLAVLLALGAAQAVAQNAAVTMDSSHAMAALDVAVIHSATCPQARYQIRISREERRVQFLVDSGKPEPTVAEIAATPFGALLLSPALGQLEFSCAGSGLNVSYVGLEPQAGAAPRGFSYSLAIGNDGAVLLDRGLRAETLEYVSLMLMKK